MRRKSQGIGVVRGVTSGGDTTSQMANEIKILSKAERESLLSKARLPILVLTNHALAMKADLAFLGTN